MKQATKEFLREIVAPTAARLALAPLAAQFRGEGLSRESFLTLCGEAFDGARLPSDEATQPGAPKPSEPPPASVASFCMASNAEAGLCEREHGHDGEHRNGGASW